MFQRVFSTKVNIIANLCGSLWNALLSVLLVPVYLRYISIEAYGLIGVFVTIQALISLLDFGLSPTINRELARLSVTTKHQEMHDLKRTLEASNWLLALSIGVVLTMLAPVIAQFWLTPRALSVTTVTQALIIIGINIAVQFSSNFYLGALMGLRKQLFYNVVIVICSSLRAIGSVIVLIYVSSTIQAFLILQGIISLVQMFLYAFILTRSLPRTGQKGVFQRSHLQRVWRFAAGMTGISIVSLVLTQLDKVILSRMLPLDDFGYYTLAVTLSSVAISIAVGAIAHSVFPEFSRLVSLQDRQALRDFYHKSCQFVSILSIPTASVLAVFAYEVLFAWTGNAIIATRTQYLLMLLAIGSGLHSLMWLPYFLQLAHGWTSLAFTINIVSIAILIPLMIFGIFYFGAVGGASAWLLLNFSYFCFTIPIMHRRILKGEAWQWYIQDVGIIIAMNLVIVGCSYKLYPAEVSRWISIAWLAATWLSCLLLPALSFPNTRRIISGELNTKWFTKRAI